jgi:hypothetical protein
VKTTTPRNLKIADHRKTLNQLVGELKRRPFDFLPERSVESLSQFFAGYGIFGPPVWRDISSFERWLAKRLFYPQDSGARWWRYIQLNEKDKFHGFELFFQLYSEYLLQKSADVQPDVQEFQIDPETFDFYLHLYAIGRKPGLYLGSGDSVEKLATYLTGYFKGKRDVKLRLTHDEKEFIRFEKWLSRHRKFKINYPWYRLIEMWRYGGLNSFGCFFAIYDAYLTDYGKKPRGLEDLFEIVEKEVGTTIRRRGKLPKKLILMPETGRWWRMQNRKQ